MAYLGRKGAVAGLTSSDIPDNSITSAKIVDGAVAVADIGNDAVGTAELANDVVISTSGAITTTGGMTVDGATVFNEASADVDFRIEGNGDANLFYADAGNDRVGVGIANPACKFEVVDSSETVAKIKQSDNAGGMNMYLALENDGGGDLYISMLQNAAQGYIKYTDDNDICFQTNGMNTRMTIDSDGRVGIGTAPSYQFHIKNSGASWTSEIQNDAGSGTVLMNYWYTSGHAPDDRTSKFIHAQDNGANRLIMWSDGDVENHDNSYGSISDERVKEDIKDANSQWDDIKALKVRNFKRKDDVKQYGENAWEQIGLVAQEAELVSPKLVKESVPSDFELEHCGFGEQNSDGEWIPKKDSDGNNMTVKGMKYSVLYMKAIKALQEAMAKIEILEAKVTALENA